MRLRRDAKIDLLANVPLLERCSKGDLAKIASIARETEFPEAKALIREGERGDDFFILLEGEVDVRRGGRKLSTLRRGDFLGEIALITGAPRTATVTTGTRVRALVVRGRDFRDLLMRSPDIQLKVLEATAERVASLTPPRRRIRLT